MPEADAPSRIPVVSGSIGATGDSTVYRALAGRAINLDISGMWVGTATVYRSFDDGATWSGLTVGNSAWGIHTSNMPEPFWEEPEPGVAFKLTFTRTSGTLVYRFSQ